MAFGLPDAPPPSPANSGWGAVLGPQKDPNMGNPSVNAPGWGTLAEAQAYANSQNQKNNKQRAVTPADQAQLAKYIQAGDFAGAWKLAAGAGNVYQKYGAAANPYYGNASMAFADPNGSKGKYMASSGQQINPLMQSLLSGQGLHSLAPNMQWNPQNTAAFYQAAAPYWNDQLLGRNPSGNWSDSKNLAQYAAQNSKDGYIPDLARYAGYADKASFGDKLASGAIGMAIPIAIGVMSGGAGAAIGGFGGAVAGGAIGGAANSAYGSYKNDTPITFGSVGKGAGQGAATAGLTYGAAPATNFLTGHGVNPIIARGIVGAGSGAVTGGIGAAAHGGNVGSGALQGAKQGGTAGLIQGAVGSTYGKQLGNNIFGNSPAGNLLSGAGTGALTGAIGGAISGRGAGSGAVSGAVGGAVQGVGTPSTPSNPNPSVPTNVNPTPSGSPSMSYDPTFDPNSGPWMGGTPGDTTGTGVGPLQDTSGGGGSAGGSYPFDPGQNPGYTNLPVQGGGGTLSGGYGGSGFWGNAGGALSGLLGGNRGGQAGNGMGGMLGSILGGLAGPAAQYFGSNMQNNQNRAAAGQFAGQAKFNPYGVSTQGGSASFKNGQATGTMSAGNQGLYNGLLQNAGANLGAMNNAGNAGVGGYRGINQGLYDANGNATSAGHNMPQQNVNGGDYGGLMGQQASMAGGLNGLAGGMAGGLTSSAQQNDFNNTFKNLQDMDRQGNNRFMSGNLDDEFAKGTLASTAGQYQTQGALDALNHQTMQNQNQAQNFAMQNAGQRLANFQGVAGQGQNYGNQFLGFGQNQYAQNANQSGVQYNRASDAFNRAMGMFSGGNQQANQNMGAYGAALGQDQQGMGQMDANQRSLLGLGGDLGAQQSNANYHAFYPQYSANSNSVNGNFLSGIGNYLGQVSGP